MADQNVVKLDPQVPQRIRPDVTIGRPGLKQFGGTLFEEFLPALQGQRGIRTYTEMAANEPVIGGFLFAINSVLTAVDWHAEPEDPKKAEDRKASEFVHSCLRDMADTWGDFVAEALSLVIYGWSWHEVTWKKREGRQSDPAKSSKFDDGLWGWREFGIRAQESLDDWKYDEKDRLLGLVQRPPPSYREIFIPLKKSLHFRLNPKKQSPEGLSLLRSCYRPWYFKKRLQELEAIGVERNLAGLPVLRIPEKYWTDTEWMAERGTWERVVRNLKRDEQEGVILPSARDEQGNLLYELTLLSTGARRQSDTNALVQRYSAEIAMAALSDFMLLGHSRVGTFALGVTKTELFATAFSYVLDVICNEINEREIPRLLMMNGMPGEAKLVHGKPGNVDIEKFSSMVKNLVDAGMPVRSASGVRERFIFQTLGLPAGDIGEGGESQAPVAPPRPQLPKPEVRPSQPAADAEEA
jgi:hypothetical protein